MSAATARRVARKQRAANEGILAKANEEKQKAIEKLKDLAAKAGVASLGRGRDAKSQARRSRRPPIALQSRTTTVIKRLEGTG